jgi:hypothetical protein
VTEDGASFQTRKYLRPCGTTNVTTVIEVNIVKVACTLLFWFGEVDLQTILLDIYVCCALRIGKCLITQVVKYM